MSKLSYQSADPLSVPVIIGHHLSVANQHHNECGRSKSTQFIKPLSTLLRKRPNVLVDVAKHAAATQRLCNDDCPPTLYVLNAAAITKPHAIEHLGADLDGYKVDIAVIKATHLKSKHADHNFRIQDYTLFCRDRTGRHGGGVAVYVSN